VSSGEQLITALGLEKFPEIRIHRVLDQAYRIYFIYIDSNAPEMPISKTKLNALMPKVGMYRYPFMARNKDRRVLTSPLLHLRDWNGNIAPADFILIDLAGRKEYMSRFLWEGKLDAFPLEPLVEGVTLKDLMNIGTSDLTNIYRRERMRLNGPENKIAKIIDCKLQPNGSAIFSWLTDVTNKYPKGTYPKEVDPITKELVIDKSFTYTIQIQIMDVVKWVDTYPDKTIITAKDVRDILSVSDIKVWSSAPSFHWQGMNFNLSVLDGAIYPTDIRPLVWGPRHNDSFLDKHIAGIFIGLKFWIHPMANMLTRQLKIAGHLQ
jgi:hypothetical protein